MFTANVGGLDRGVRLVLGLALVAAGLWTRLVSGVSTGTLVAVLGLLLFTTGLTRFCILYVPFGFSTARRRAGSARGSVV